MTQEVDVPLFTGAYKNIEGEVLKDQLFKIIDGYLDEAPSINVRPGLDTKGTLNSRAPIDGMYYWAEEDLIAVVSNGDIWGVPPTSFSAFNMSIDRVSINAGTRPSIAKGEGFLYIANGGKIAYTDLSTTLAFIGDSDAPKSVTHIVMLDGYLIANNGTQRFYFAEVDDPQTWSALDFASAKSKPDAIQALYEFGGELYIFGKTSLEIWENDGQTPFARVGGGAFNTGCIAPYSVVETDNGVIWLSNRRKFARFKGRDIETFNTAYDKEIQGYPNISDCTADRIDINGKTFLIFHFNTANKTLYYNVDIDQWGEWGSWDSASGSYNRWLGNCHAFVTSTGQHIVGSRKPDGRFFHLSSEYKDDDGTDIRLCVQSGHINYGTNKKKRNHSFTMRAKRGEGVGSSEPKMMLRYRDDNREWSNEQLLGFGKTGEYFNHIRKLRQGIYGTRQYEFSATAAVGWTFSEAKEEIEVLR
jgi:hypothetical protein